MTGGHCILGLSDRGSLDGGVTETYDTGIPELVYPHTKFPSECCTPVHDSLVDPVRGYNIRVVD